MFLIRIISHLDYLLVRLPIANCMAGHWFIFSSTSCCYLTHIQKHRVTTDTCTRFSSRAVDMKFVVDRFLYRSLTFPVNYQSTNDPYSHSFTCYIDTNITKHTTKNKIDLYKWIIHSLQCYTVVKCQIPNKLQYRHLLTFFHILYKTFSPFPLSSNLTTPIFL